MTAETLGNLVATWPAYLAGLVDAVDADHGLELQ